MELEFLEKRWSLRIIAFLFNQEPLRFKELKKICSREATLSIRVRELEHRGLIETLPIKAKSQRYFAYRLTEKGNKIAQKVQEIKRI